jgi:long-chain acyl-CoA synthetase
MNEHSPLLSAIIENSVRLDKTAVIMGNNVVSYAQLVENIRKAASFMKQHGLHRGDKIILSAHKDIEYIYLYFASHILGVVNVIVDAESNEERLRYIEHKIEPAFCFGYTSPSTKSFLFEEINLGNMEPLVESEESISVDDIAEILFTTGTTGAPKGVCLSYGEIYSSASNINEYIGNQSDDIELLGLPICHSFGLGRIRCVLIKGATIVILPNFANVRQYLKAIEQYKITGFGVVPAAWAYIRKMSGTRIAKYADQIRYIEIGSAAMPLDTKKEMLTMFPNTRICMHYGLTEASRNCFIEFHDEAHLSSIGKPVCDKVDVRIFGPMGELMQVNESGELCVKGNMVLSHYLDEADNHNAFYGDYFRTGDCGYMDADGYLYLIGREKELINVGGKKVSPMEVEDAIMSLGVGDCVCVPIKDAQGIIGEQVFCYVLRGSTTLSFEEISQKLSVVLEFYKRPVAYDWIDEIPMTASGKKQRLQVTK